MRASSEVVKLLWRLPGEHERIDKNRHRCRPKAYLIALESDRWDAASAPAVTLYGRIKEARLETRIASGIPERKTHTLQKEGGTAQLMCTFFF